MACTKVRFLVLLSYSNSGSCCHWLQLGEANMASLVLFLRTENYFKISKCKALDPYAQGLKRSCLTYLAQNFSHLTHLGSLPKPVFIINKECFYIDNSCCFPNFAYSFEPLLFYIRYFLHLKNIDALLQGRTRAFFFRISVLNSFFCCIHFNKN